MNTLEEPGPYDALEKALPEEPLFTLLARDFAAPAPVVLSGIKGMSRDLKCRDFQFAPGQTYEVKGRASCCENGFHAIPDDVNPLMVFGFYPPGTSRYFAVEQSGNICRSQADKAASTILAVKVEIGLEDIIARRIDWSRSRAGPTGAASNRGDYGAAFSTGYGGKVMSEKDGCSLHCDERDDKHNIVSAACGITGRDGIKAGVWYVCRDGKLVEVA